MTDDLEPRLRDHLRQRASRVSAGPDLGDLHQRIGARGGRTSRALGAALALSLVAGPVSGWALARSSETDRDDVSALGGGATASGADAGYEAGGGVREGGPGYLDPEMELVSDRTTEEGIRLVVRSTDLGTGGGACEIDGLVRVGIVDGDLIDVARFETTPGGAQFGIAGGADGRPMWVVLVRGFDEVGATFPSGVEDATPVVRGVAVLAAYADEGQSPLDLVDDVVEIQGAMRGSVMETRRVSVADGTGGCSDPDRVITDPAEEPIVMPEPGEPPADEASARAAIEELFSGLGGQDPELEMDQHERPNVWRDADARFREEHPEYLEWAKQVYSVPLEIVFTAPDRATVRYDLVSDNPDVPAPGERTGEAVLVDGVWKVSVETSCADLALAGIECDLSIEG